MGTQALGLRRRAERYAEHAKAAVRSGEHMPVVRPLAPQPGTTQGLGRLQSV
jgi:hypothetical protein